MAITQHTTLQWRCSSPPRRARPRYPTHTSSIRTGSASTASGRRRTNSRFSTPPTRSSLGAKSTSKGGIRRHGYYHRERLVRYYIGALRGLGDRFEDEVCGRISTLQDRAGRRSLYEHGELFEKQEHSELHTGIALCRACAPIHSAHHTISHLQKECRHSL
jgi:hypothetical protein